MSSFQEQLKYLNQEAEAALKRKHKRPPAMGKSGACQCSTDTFIDYSKEPRRTRAAFISTWLIGFNAEKYNQHFFKDHEFIMISSHGIPGYTSASWLVYSPRRAKKQFMDYDLISNFFKESINYYIQACDNHHRVYPCINQQILNMADEECRERLLIDLNNVMPDWGNA
ncbi:hypothetical protein OAT47_00505 [Gammaproteobacteria bacterium]|nr:hypothetical protein [Gammaproteobacteria bacterium]